MRVRAPDGNRTVAALYPEDYAVGSTVAVRVDGDWERLAAEPYDAFEWQLLTLAAGLRGLSFLAAGVLARRRAAALRRRPVPVLRALHGFDEAGSTCIYAADDIAGRTPILICATVPDDRDWDDEDDEENAEEGPDADDEGVSPFDDDRLYEAVSTLSGTHAPNNVTAPFYEPKSIVFTKRRSVTDGPSFVPTSTQ